MTIDEINEVFLSLQPDTQENEDDIRKKLEFLNYMIESWADYSFTNPTIH